MKNCQIVIRRKDSQTVAFTFDDYRIAQAVINILDNVSEPNIENDFEYRLIQKEFIDINNIDISGTIGGKNDFADCIRDSVQAVIDNAKPVTEQEIVKPYLEKLRAEIMDMGAYEQEVNGKTEFLKGINYCLGVIDKYEA